MADRRKPAAPRRALPASDEPADADARVESRDPEELSFGGHVLAFFRELSAVVVGAVIVASLLRGFVGQMFLIPSISMENTLKNDDRVLVEKLTATERGEVMVFKDPGGWLTGTPSEERGPIGKVFQFVGVLPDTSTEHLIKRVVGLPGDHVLCCDAEGRVTVNGQPLDETLLPLRRTRRCSGRAVADRVRCRRARQAPFRARRQPRAQPRLAVPPQ